MRKAAAFGLFALGMLGLTEARAAEYQAEALLARALPATTDTEIDGVNWRCTGDKCVATPVGRKAVRLAHGGMQEARGRARQALQLLHRGKEMSKRDLENCNRGAR